VNLPNRSAELDKIFIAGLEVETVIGIWDWERRIRQTVRLDLEMATDARASATSDSIDDSLNYKEVAKRLIAFVSASEFQLVEALAEAVARIIVEEFGVSWVQVRVAKPGAVEQSREVGIMIERTRADYG
jgi:7,8-dihydroneopterin aldolase/epimerase/oxygenase